MEKEYLSEWFIEGLKEIGITEQEYHKKTQDEKNKIKKYLEEFGHF
jgi:hypothetical protein